MNRQFNAMVIDDHPLQTTLLTHALRKHDAYVSSFNCVEEAIQCARTTKFDVIFCDIMMPEKDGVDMMELLDYINYQGKVVIVSAMDLTMISALQAMCADFSFEVVGKLQKPYDQTEVADIIQNMQKEHQQKAADSSSIMVEDQEFLFSLGEGLVKNYYQPLIDTKTGEVLGYEALARWYHPIYGVLSPYHFLSIVERCDLSKELFEAVLSNVICDIKSHGITKKVSINAEQANLEDRNFASYVLQQCHEHDINPEQLTIEITERDTFQASASLYKNLLKLRMNGVTVSIDDFGTGSSTFEKLAQLPFNELKIDRAFVYGIESDPKKRNIVAAIRALAKSLNIPVVAEGVEDEATMKVMREYGIDLCQGFYINKPMPLEAITVLN
ncbi:COG0784 FOG CheY-like receiver [Vibrio sp. B1FLJ16]|uniref:EAL domain-containing response regulator n=1 Tax=Vibrio sp. B1FLJ16 TaxID=2751178 RepID=UPI0015F50BD2|nr:EAL domain-containing response regulator [Vibrio sp. B1FLJ16]CAD7821259.1 COG0784 FOG CheY-like receiver [Vibrio sp. B1FLJ16]CAE6945631.1 COG0784 FOG CheY-like receiver [Vibrio sp. B1FLJ16]